KTDDSRLTTEDQRRSRWPPPPAPDDVPQRTYFSPLPVLKSTTSSVAERMPSRTRWGTAAAVAAPSGAQKTPVRAPTVSVQASISSSVTVTAAPPDSRMARRMRKSPTAEGTRMPEANVVAFGQGSANSSPAAQAFTIGAQPA